MRPESPLSRSWAVLAAVLLWSGSALAAPAWRDLSPEQQQIIAPALVSQGGDFDRLSEPRRMALAKGAERWLAMSPPQRAVATEQFRRWQQLDSAEKRVVLERRERFRKMTPAQRKALLDTQRRFEQLTLQQQQDLRDEFSELVPPLEDDLAVEPVTSPATPTTPTPGPITLPAAPLNNVLNLPALPR